MTNSAHALAFDGTDVRPPISASHLSCLRPAGWELAGISLLVIYQLFSTELFGQDSYSVMNIVGPLWLICILGAGIGRMAWMNSDSLWGALFWFRLSTGAYFGVGNLIPIFSNDNTRAYIDAFYAAYGDDIAKVNLLVSASVFVVLSTASILVPLADFLMRDNGASKNKDEPAARNDFLRAGVVTYALGAFIKYVIVFPYLLGLTQGTLGSALGQFSGLVMIGIYFLSAWSFGRGGSMVWAVVALLLFEMFVSIMIFGKSETLMALVMFFLGMLRNRIALPRVLTAVLAIVATYVAITPIVNYGRITVINRYGNLAASVGFSERVAIVMMYFEDDAEKFERAEVNGSVVRLSYTNVAAFAISRYDAGIPGNSLDNFYAVFIPRFLWPEKPIITDIGTEFNLAAMGFSSSSASPGLFADAYWNFGWWGICFLIVPLGAILTVASVVTLDIFRRKKWLFFPIVLLGLKMGFRTDGFFVSDILGTTVYMIVLFLILCAIDWCVPASLQRAR